MPSGAWLWLPHSPPQSSPAFPVPIPDSSKAICLPYFDEELVPGTPLWVIGWGYTQKHGEWDSAPSTTRRMRAGGLPPGSPLRHHSVCRQTV